MWASDEITCHSWRVTIPGLCKMTLFYQKDPKCSHSAWAMGMSPHTIHVKVSTEKEGEPSQENFLPPWDTRAGPKRCHGQRRLVGDQGVPGWTHHLHPRSVWVYWLAHGLSTDPCPEIWLNPFSPAWSTLQPTSSQRLWMEVVRMIGGLEEFYFPTFKRRHMVSLHIQLNGEGMTGTLWESQFVSLQNLQIKLLERDPLRFSCLTCNCPTEAANCPTCAKAVSPIHFFLKAQILTTKQIMWSRNPSILVQYTWKFSMAKSGVLCDFGNIYNGMKDSFIPIGRADIRVNVL